MSIIIDYQITKVLYDFRLNHQNERLVEMKILRLPMNTLVNDYHGFMAVRVRPATDPAERKGSIIRRRHARFILRSVRSIVTIWTRKVTIVE